MKEILVHIIPSPDFKLQAFCSVIDTILSEHPTGQGILIIRRERNVAQGYRCIAVHLMIGSLGGTFTDKVVSDDVSGNWNKRMGRKEALGFRI